MFLNNLQDEHKETLNELANKWGYTFICNYSYLSFIKNNVRIAILLKNNPITNCVKIQLEYVELSFYEYNCYSNLTITKTRKLNSNFYFKLLGYNSDIESTIVGLENVFTDIDKKYSEHMNHQKYILDTYKLVNAEYKKKCVVVDKVISDIKNGICELYDDTYYLNKEYRVTNGKYNYNSNFVYEIGFKNFGSSTNKSIKLCFLSGNLKIVVTTGVVKTYTFNDENNVDVTDIVKQFANDKAIYDYTKDVVIPDLGFTLNE